MTKNPIFQGAATALVTPLNEQGVDYPALERLIEWQIAEGISALVKGMKVEEAVARLKGIQCGMRGTSCPDQLACALEAHI